MLHSHSIVLALYVSLHSCTTTSYPYISLLEEVTLKLYSCISIKQYVVKIFNDYKIIMQEVTNIYGMFRTSYT